MVFMCISKATLMCYSILYVGILDGRRSSGLLYFTETTNEKTGRDEKKMHLNMQD